MSCPDTDVLTVYASLAPGELASSEPILGDWTGSLLQRHLEGCEACRSALGGWRDSLSAWGNVDLVDTSRFDADYFERLGQEVTDFVERGGVPRTTIALRPRQLRTRWALFGAVAAAVLVAVLLQRPGDDGPQGPIAEIETLSEDAEEVGRSLGRQLLAAALADDIENLGVAPASWLDLDDDDRRYSTLFHTSLTDALDDFDDDELDAIILRL